MFPHLFGGRLLDSIGHCEFSPLSQCIPMLCLTPAFAVVHGYLLLDETLHLSQICGLILSAVGAAGFGLEKGWSRAKGRI